MNERQIFEAALDIADPVRREVFLSQTCGADAALRARVDALLASHAAASQFLETPAVQQLSSLDPQVRANRHPPDSSGEDTMQLPPSHLSAEGDSDDEIPNGPDISFLSPSQKAGSTGTLGHYEILNVLGQGAFGIVFRAFDEKLHRHVAIKTMSVQMAATSPPRKRFLREARAAAAIRHENVVQVYSVEEQPLPYLVMEFIDGQTLQQKQRTVGPLELPELLHIGRQIAAGLAAAHAQSLIHRDVKPGNILIEKGAEQRVKITDFGLARAADDASLTRSGMISGTPLYMAPEQALGQAIDHRSDLFSLGSVLYELATGRPPFRAPNTVAVLRRVVDDTPRPIQEIIPESPDWLVTIVNKLLEKKPEDRYQSAKEVADLLTRCQSELQLTGQVTCVTPPRAGSVSARSTPSDATIVRPANRLPKTSETSEVSPSRTAQPSAKAILGFLTIAALIPILWYALPPSPNPPAIDRSGSRKTSADPGDDGKSLTTSATGQPTGWHGWPADAPAPAIAPFDAEQAKKHQEAWAQYLGVPVEYTNSLAMKFVLIPPGEFTMGSTAEEIAASLKDAPNDKQWQECIKSEAPQHKVILTQPIYLGMNEVTQAKYEKVMGSNPSHFTPTGMGKDAVAGLETAEHPVEMVSWNDAAEFCAKLSQQEKLNPFYFRAGETLTPLDGTSYRLPSEAEWEFACRAGTSTKYWIGDQHEDLVRAGWFGGNSGGRTHAAGELKANPFGLADIHSNVLEWVQDGWDATYYGQFQEKPAINPNSPFSAGSQRVIRGGDWNYTASSCRSSFRRSYDPSGRTYHIGFRVSLPVDAVRQALKVTSPALPKPVATTPSALASDLIDYAAERRVAEWAIGAKARVQIEVAGQVIHVPDVAQLPSGPFYVQGLAFVPQTALKPSDLQMIGKLRNLKVLSLRETSGVDAAPGSLTQLTTLEYLNLLGCGITDTDMPQLSGMKNLAHLELAFTAVSNAGMAAVSQLTHLKYLGLGESRVGDEGLAQLKALDQVEFISLGATVTDQGLGQLANFPKLTEVGGMKSHHLTEAGIGHLQQLPNVTHLNVVVATDADLVRLKPLAHLTALSFNLHQFSPSGLEALSEFPKLDYLILGGHPNFDDSYWPPLVKLSTLRTLYLQEVQVTAEGIAKFREQRPEVWLKVNATIYPASPIASDAIDYAAERQVAEWAVGAKTRFNVESAGQVINITDVSQLPSGPFHIHAIAITPQSTFGPNDFAQIGRLRGMIWLGFEEPLTDGSCLVEVAKVKSLKGLTLQRAQITDAHLSALTGLQNLADLDLTFTPIGDASIGAVAQLTGLKKLHLGESRVGDEGLAQLKTLCQLEFLHLGGTVTDQGLGHLANLPKLTAVAGLKSHHLTEVGIGHLQQLPNVTTLNVVAATDEDLIRLKPVAHLTALTFNFHQFSASGLEALSAFPKLDYLDLGDQPSVDDSYWPPLVKLSALRKLLLQKVKVTTEGIAKFREQRPEVLLNVNGEEYPATKELDAQP